MLRAALEIEWHPGEGGGRFLVRGNDPRQLLLWTARPDGAGWRGRPAFPIALSAIGSFLGGAAVVVVGIARSDLAHGAIGAGFVALALLGLAQARMAGRILEDLLDRLGPPPPERVTVSRDATSWLPRSRVATFDGVEVAFGGLSYEVVVEVDREGAVVEEVVGSAIGRRPASDLARAALAGRPDAVRAHLTAEGADGRRIVVRTIEAPERPRLSES